MKLTLRDKKLLYWLDQDSRASKKSLGKKINLSEQGVGYKLNTLEKKGIIKRYITFINTLALGYSHYKVLMRLQNISPSKEKEIINYLIAHNNIRWIVSCSGKWDLNFSITAKTPEEYISIYQDIESNFGDFIAEKNVSLLVNAPGFTKGYLINKKSLKTMDYKPEIIADLDIIDKKILKSISQHARKNVIDIASEIKTSSDIVRYRLKKLIEKNIINGFTIQLDHKKIDIMKFSVYFSLHKMNKTVEKQMIEFAKINNNIVFILFMIGSYDISLELETSSYKNLDDTIKKFREKFANHISNFEIIMNTDEYKYDFYTFK